MLMISIAWLFYLYEYVLRVEPSVLVNDLMGGFGLNSSMIGFVISVLYIPYVALQVPCGMLTDKLGVRGMIAISSALCGVGAFIFGSATCIFQLELGRFLIGVASASAFLCCGKVAIDFFEKSKVSMLMSITMFMGCFGGISGAAPTAFLVDKIGWRQTTFIFAAAGIVISIIAALLLKNKKEEKATEEKNKSQQKILDGIKKVIKNKKTWIVGIYGMASYLPLSAIAELWGIPFLEQRYGVSTEKAALSSAFIFIGFGVGGIIFSWLAEKINSYKNAISISAVGMLIAFIFAIYNDSLSFELCVALLFFCGLFAGANTLCFALSIDLVPAEFGGTSTGFMNMLIMSSGVIFQPILGRLLDFFRNGLVTDAGTPIYNLTMFRSAFVFVVVSMICALVATFFTNDVKRASC
ncbi:MFS transporter [Alphaproteobacteria bacterium]|nr:MFS transporter [Alphaproteobacteria bacterium]